MLEEEKKRKAAARSKPFATGTSEAKKKQYQQAQLANSQPVENSNWYKGEKPTQRETLARIYDIGNREPEKRDSLMQMYQAELSNPTSPIYNPYSSATTTSLSKTNLNNTLKAHQEWAELSKELTWWAQHPSRNYSDDEIIRRVDWNKYKTLAKMDAGRESGSPLALTEAVGYSRDAMYGVLWAARNPNQSTGDAMLDAVQGVLGRGKQYQFDEKTANRLDPTSTEYNPYAVGSTMDELAYKYGTYEFNQEWLDNNRHLIANPDTNADYGKIYKAVQNTEAINTEAQSFTNDVARLLEAGQPVDVDKIIELGEYSHLKKMRESLKSGQLIDTTAAIDFDPYLLQTDADAYLQQVTGDYTTDQYDQMLSDNMGGSYLPDESKQNSEELRKLNTDVNLPEYIPIATEQELRAFKTTANAGYSDVVYTTTDLIANGTGGLAQANAAQQKAAHAYANKNLFDAWDALNDEVGFTDVLDEDERAFLQKYFPEKYAAGELPTMDDFGLLDMAAVDPESGKTSMDVWQEWETMRGHAESVTADMADRKAAADAARQTVADVMDDLAEVYGEGTEQYNAAVATYEMAYAYSKGVPKTWQSYDAFQQVSAQEGATAESLATTLTNLRGANARNILVLNALVENAEIIGIPEADIRNMRQQVEDLKTQNDLLAAHNLSSNEDYASQVAAFDAQFPKADGMNLFGQKFSTHEDAVRQAVADPEYGFYSLTTDVNPTEITMLAQAMTDEERNNYKYIYMTEGQERATAYFDALSENLYVRAAEERSERTQEWAAENELNSAIATVGSVFLTPMEAASALATLVEFVQTGKVNAYGMNAMASRMKGDLRTGAKEGAKAAWGEENKVAYAIYSTVYDALTSAADSMVASKFGSSVGAAMMGASAFNSGTMEASMRGASGERALLFGAASALIEAGSEKISIDRILGAFDSGASGVRGLLDEIAKGFFSEGAEEMASTLGSAIADDMIMGAMANRETAIAAYMEAGLTREEAEAQAAKDILTDIAYSGLVGGISGSFSSGLEYGRGALTGKSETTALDNTPTGTPVQRAEAALSTSMQDGVGEVQQTATVAGVLQSFGLSDMEANAAAKNIVGSTNTRVLRKMLSQAEDPVGLIQAIAMGSVSERSRSWAVLHNAMVDSKNAKDVGDQLIAAYNEDVNDQSVMTEYDARVAFDAQADATANIIATSGQVDTSALDKTREQSTNAQLETARAEAEVEASNQAVVEAQNRFNANPGDDKAKQALKEAINLQYKARERSEAAKRNAILAKKNLAKADADFKAQTEANMIAAREQAKTDVQQRKEALEAKKEEATAAAEARRESDNETALEVDDFINTMLQGREVTDEERGQIKRRLAEKKKVVALNASNETGSGARATFVTQMQKKFGVKIRVMDTTEGGQYLRYNGAYDPKTDSIVIDSKATQSDVIYGVLLHELTHKAERSGTYQEFASAILQIKYKGDDQRLAADIRAKQDSYNKRLKAMQALDSTVEATPLTADQASREIVADLTREILFSDEASIQQLCAEKPSVAKRILETIKNFLNQLRGVNDPAVNQLNRARDLFEQALMVKSSQMKPGEVRSFPTDNIQYSLREEPDPVNTIKGYKVFVVFDNKPGELYPPMVANPGGESTPIGVWLNADAAPRGADSKTGRAQVQAGGKGTQASKMSLAYRPGWHLGDLPMATQFLRKNPETGKKELFPANFVWAECECAADHDYQEEAMSYGYTKNGKFQHSLAGLPRLPREEDGTAGYYRYRTNPNPDTVPWIITGAMKVTRILDDAETDAILREAGVEPIPRQGGPIDLEKFGLSAGDVDSSDRVQYSIDESYDESLLSPSEYRRLSSNWTDYTERGYKFAERPSGGIIVAMDNLIVYTDKDGNPVQAIEVNSEDLWQLNNIQQDLIEMEEEGYDFETQRALLEGVYGESSAHFRKGGTVPQPSGENRGGAKRLARAVRVGNRVEVSFEDEGVKPTAKQEIKTDSGEVAAEVIRGGVSKQYSLASWTESERKTVRETLIKNGFGPVDADKWISDVDSVASIISNDKARLDYQADPDQVMLKNNQEYVKTLDASTLCAKRLLYQGTFNEIQHLLPNTVITSDMLLDLLNMMKDAGYETPCGVCYVESRRRHLGKFAEQWLHGRPKTKEQKAWEPYSGEYVPTLDELTTTDGLAKLKEEHYNTYKAFMGKMASLGSSNPKIVELRTDYRGDVRKLTKSQIEKIVKIGGLRVQSFSDFETPHLIDMVQAVLDMAGKKLTSQAYTKVPNFAWVFGDTGIKINLSLLAEGNGLDENGNLIFSSSEGMDFDEAMRLRDRYSQNVGTIIVGANDAHIRAAMADPRIDYIIPFHRSGWGQNELKKVGVLQTYTDYQATQNERMLDGSKPEGGNFYPIDYWDYSKTGDENAATYLRMCEEDGRIPKFEQFLTKDEDGHWVAPSGYWKMLIDFKMYDNDGNGAPQQTVQPNFNMEEAVRVLKEYEGGANTLPVAQDIVDRFVADYKAANPSKQYSLPSDNLLDELIDSYLAGNAAPSPRSSVETTEIPKTKSPKLGTSQFAAKTGQNTSVLSNDVKNQLRKSPFYQKTSERQNMDIAINNIEIEGYETRRNKLLDGSINLFTPEGQVEAFVLAKAAKEADDAQGESAIAFKVKESGTLLGQSLAMRRMYLEMTPEGKTQFLQRTVDKINQDYANQGKATRVVLPVWFEARLKEADGDEEAIAKIVDKAYTAIAEQMPPDWKSRLNAWRYTAMLANPRTHIRNIAGNLMFMPAVSIKNKIGAVAEMAFAAPEERTKTLAPVRQEYKDFATAQLEDVKEALTGGGKHNPMSEIQSRRRDFNTKALEWLSKGNGKLLEEEDAFFLNKHFVNALSGFLQARNVDVNNIDANTLQAGLDYAVLEAQKATYRDASELADKLSKFTSSLSNSKKRSARAAGLLVEGALPFKKTPINVMRRGIEYSPVGLLNTLTTGLYDMKKGNIEKTEFLDRLASGITGTGLAAVGAMLYSAGHLKLSLDDPEDELEKLSGAQEYSIELFGKSFTIDWLSPSAMPLFVGGAIAELFEKDGEGFNLNTVIDALMSIAEPVFNLSMLDGVNSLLSAASNSENGVADIAIRAAESYATQFVPTVLGAFARTFDPVRRTTYTDKNSGMPNALQYLRDSVVNKIPGASYSGQPYLNAWGEEDTTESFFMRAVENFLSPGYINDLTTDDVEKGLMELYDETKEPGLVPKLPQKYFTVNKQRKDLTGDEYERLVKERGQTAKSLHEQLFGNPEFLNLPAKYQVYALEQVWEYATQTAKQGVAPEYETDSWVASAKNPADAVLEKTLDKAKKDRSTEMKNNLYSAIDSGDLMNAATYVEGIMQGGTEKGSLRTSITNQYKSKYQQMYADGDIEGMRQLENTLLALNVGYKLGTIQKWIVDNEE